VRGVKVMMALVLTLVIQWVQIVPVMAAPCSDAQPCECCIPSACPCVEDAGEMPDGNPLAPVNAFKLEPPVPAETHRPAVAMDRPAGHRGVALKVSFCRFLI
jgi:hypothetical protein